ncbi:hypothetical protein PV325_013778 [Microctonus aethiopoides]|nr:hypothetical protein PV325_013778 [Microctonus aethiopoides]
MNNLTRFCIRKTARIFLLENKRFAGHSKWQNIKHIKGEKDAEKSALYALFAKRMKVAIAEGKSSKPETNLKLAQIIEEAKKKCMPVATINGVLEKVDNAKAKTIELVDFRGPGTSIFVLKLLTENLKGIRMNLNTVFKKNACVPSDGKSLNAFYHQGFILTDLKGDLDTATNDAINVGAEDVEEVTENNTPVYRFSCNPSHVAKVTQQLTALNYKIITADEDFIPRSPVNLSDDDFKKVEVLCSKLSAFEEIQSFETLKAVQLNDDGADDNDSSFLIF